MFPNFGTPEIIIMLAILVGIPVGIVYAFRNTSAIRGQGKDDRSPLDDPDVRRELDAMQARLTELEERMDMADRLLASQKRSKPLG